MKRIAWPLVAALFALSMTACRTNPLVKEINRRFPPVSPADLQLAAIRAASRDLASLGEPTAYAAVTVDHIRAAIPSEIEAAIDRSGGTIKASGVKVDLGEQEVIVRTNFVDLLVDEGRTRVAGEVEAHCAVSVENGSLVLRPSASRIKVSKLKVGGTKVPDVLTGLISAAIAPFLDNLNGAIKSTSVPINLHDVQTIDLAKLIADAPQNSPEIRRIENVRGSTISVNAALGRTSVLIEPAALRVLGEGVVLTAPRVAQVIGELGAIPATAPPFDFSSAQLALLSECVHDEYLLPTQFKDDFRNICTRWRPNSAHAEPPAPMPMVTTLAVTDVASEYAAFREAFRAAAARVDDPASLFWDRTAVAIAREPIVAALNELLVDSSAGATVHIASQHSEIPEQDRTVRTDKAPDLKCDLAGGPCPSVFEYRPHNPRGCKSDCIVEKDVIVFGVKVGTVKTLDLVCQAEKIHCESLKEAERLAYESEKAAALVAWSAAKAACEAAKVGQQAGCRLNQGFLNDWSERDIGEIRGSFTLHEPVLNLGVDNVRVENDFDGFTLRTKFSGGGDVQGSFTFIPHNAGHLICHTEWSGDIRAHTIVPEQEWTVLARRGEPAREGKNLRIQYDVPEHEVQVKFDPPPVKAIIEQNPAKLAVNCPVPIAIIGALAGFTPVNILVGIKLGEAIFDDSRDIKIPGRSFPLIVPSRELTFGVEPRTVTLTLEPHWKTKAFVFSTR